MLSKHFFLPLYLNMGPPPYPSRYTGRKYLSCSTSKEFRTVYLKDVSGYLVDVYYSWVGSRSKGKLTSQFTRQRWKSAIRSKTKQG